MVKEVCVRNWEIPMMLMLTATIWRRCSEDWALAKVLVTAERESYRIPYLISLAPFPDSP